MAAKKKLPKQEHRPEDDVSNDFLKDIDYDGDAVVFDANGKLVQASRLGERDAKPAKSE